MRKMNKTIVIITGIIVTGLLIGYYLYLNKAGNVTKTSLKGDTQLVESYAYDGRSTVRETIDNKLHRLKGDFKVIGWKTKRIDEQTLLASYTYKKNGRAIGWFFEVKSGKIIRNVSNDKKLMKKYNVVNRTVFTEEDRADLEALKEKSVVIGMNKTGQPRGHGRYGGGILVPEAFKYLSSDEEKRALHLSEKFYEYREGILMLKQE